LPQLRDRRGFHLDAKPVIGVVVDAAGNVYVADSGNRVVKLAPESEAQQILETSASE
jgi:DNA-binding beta-propeller fold protein YncE